MTLLKGVASAYWWLVLGTGIAAVSWHLVQGIGWRIIVSVPLAIWGYFASVASTSVLTAA